MVDASLRMSIVNLLRDLRDHFGVTVIYITHDLATAYYISNRIVIMQKGHIVEMGPAQAILEAPEHPYAQLLKNSVLSIDDAGHGKVQPPDRSLAQAVAEKSGSGMLVEGSGGGGYALRSRFRGIHYTDDRSNPFQVWCDAQPQEHLYARAGDAI